MCARISGDILLVDLSSGKSRLGGSALGQCYNQLGSQSPDMDDPETFVKAFNTTQTLIQGRFSSIED